MKKIITLLLSITILGCSGNSEKMNTGDKYIAEKSKAEYVDMRFVTEKSDNEAKKKGYFLIEITNSETFNSVLNDDKLFHKECKRMAEFILNDITIDKMPYQPYKLQFKVTKTEGNLLAEKYVTKTLSLDLKY